ncbi:hypothetical protein F4806DRAFT_464150 [Annulohypoxylon nitens]|nr:hypothetical protein F4806DRAFT_464150 [Annulohypoxylon nitens]
MTDPEPPFSVDIFANENGATNPTGEDLLPASCRFLQITDQDKYRVLTDPNSDIPRFLKGDLSLEVLEKVSGPLWESSSKKIATRLHLQIAMGRTIVVYDGLNFHLLCDQQNNIYVKPIPRYLLCSDFWKRHLKCPADCSCIKEPRSNCGSIRGVAFGFLYTYSGLISTEVDFHLANEKYLLPRKKDGSTIEWEKWKTLSREVLKRIRPNKIHPRFLDAELRVYIHSLGIADTLIGLRSLKPYSPDSRRSVTLFRNYMTAAGVFIALILTALQVGLATDGLKDDPLFQGASYTFTVIAILCPICAYLLMIMAGAFNVVRYSSWYLYLFGRIVSKGRNGSSDSQTNKVTVALYEAADMV